MIVCDEMEEGKRMSKKERTIGEGLIVSTAICALLIAIGAISMILGVVNDERSAASGVYTKGIIYSADNPIPQIAARVRPAVAQIIAEKEVWSADYGVWTEPLGSGSGVYIDERGYIVTNYHVVEGADIVTVQLLDGTEIEVEQVLSDESTDLALLKVDPDAMPEDVEPVPMGDSDELMVGELAIVIGNPGALSDVYPGTVTAGIISGLERENVNAGNFSRTVNVIQMDAPINGGNSGGALLNGRGELVGIPTLKIDMTYYGRSIEGMGFAIPVNLVKDVVASLIEYGKVLRPRMGVSIANFSGPDEPIGRNPPAGIQVMSVEEGTPAEEAGVVKYDIITHVNGVRVKNYTQMNTHIDRYMAGDIITLTVYRCYDPVSAQLMELKERKFIDLTVELKLID